MVRFTKKTNLQSISIICLDKNVQIEYQKFLNIFVRCTRIKQAIRRGIRPINRKYPEKGARSARHCSFYENDKDGNMRFVGENAIGYVATGEKNEVNFDSFLRFLLMEKL